MFPNADDINLIATRHVESVVLLSKITKKKEFFK